MTTKEHTDEKTLGFQGEISAVGVLRDSVPVEVKPVAEEPSSQDLSLARMARWALTYLIRNPMKELDYEVRFCIWPLKYPPVPPGHHPIGVGDTDIRMDLKFMYMRDMCRELPDFDREEGLEVEEGLRRRVLGYVREDGFSHTLVDHCCDANVAPYLGEPRLSVWATTLTIVNLAETYRRSGDLQAKTLAKKMLVSLRGLASWDTGRAWYAGGGGPYVDGQWIDCWGARNYPAVLRSVLHYWEATGDEEEMEFAVALADGMIDNLQTNLGVNRINEDGSYQGHTWAHGHAMWEMARLGLTTRESRYLEWARRPYQYLVSHGGDYGWLPQDLGGVTGDPARAETCGVSNAIATAACLAKAGYPRYWDHVERFVRNYIRSAQFFVTPEYEAFYRDMHRDNPEQAEDGLRIMKELEGGFVAEPTPNDWVIRVHRPDGSTFIHVDMMGCCSPGGMQALYTAWSNIVTESPQGVFINLSFNRESPQADVVSYLPDQGRLTVVVKKASDFHLRPPAWAPRGEVKAWRGSEPVAGNWRGDYVRFPKATVGEELTITYPLLRFTQEMPLGHGPERQTFTIKWLGNTVVELKPAGQYLPLFTGRPLPS